MKRNYIILLMCMLASLAMAGVHSYTDHSVLNTGTFVKISVQETGVHSLSYETLKEWGLKPENVAVLGYGGAMLSEDFTKHHWDDLPVVPIYMHKGADGVFNKGDYILFYAQGTTEWSFSQRNKQWTHTQNPYSKLGYYFVTDQLHLQSFIAPTNEQISSSSVIDVDWYMSLNLHEKDTINLIDTKGQAGGGREFYGETLNSRRTSLAVPFALNNIREDLPARCVVSMAAYSGEATPVQISLAGVTETMTLSPIPVTDYHQKATTKKTTITTQIHGEDELTVNLLLKSPAGTAYLNYIEMFVPCELRMHGNEMSIVNTEYFNNYQAIRYHLQNAHDGVQVWRVTAGKTIQQMPLTKDGNEATWIDSNTSAERYVAVDVKAGGWKQPKYVGKVDNQDLHALENIDYVIITPEDFYDASVRLAKKHEQIDTLTWAVVTDEQVYNEFSSGTPDASAYRWLMKMLYDRANGDPIKQPKNLLLMGDGTFDNRKLLRESGANVLLTYQAVNSVKETEAYATDDYFGFMADDAGINQGTFSEVYAIMDIGVGRLPVKNVEEADQVVEKICTYMDDKVLGKWKSQILFLADDGDHGLHVQTADKGAEKLRLENKDFVVNKIYLDAHTQEVSAAGESYPLAKNQFDNLISNGVLMMNYSGHGGYNNITNELFMKSADIQKMNNVNQGFWFLATCSFSHFDAGATSAGELAVLNPHGAAIGVLSACRTVYAAQNTEFNKNLCDTIMGHANPYTYSMTLGEATRIAKNRTGYDSNKLPYILLADPALRLNYPTDLQVKTELIADTMHALTPQIIKGYISQPNNDTASWFNGQLDVTIYDKQQLITTRDNDESVEENKVKIPYNDYPNVLFSGQTDVIDGKFAFTFMVPKDIRYNYGSGRIVYYAHDGETREEAVGHYEKFVVGGSTSGLIQDTVGPELSIYLNTPAFEDDGETHEYPHFFAEIYDESGINTVGTGIGHDLLLVVDGDSKQTYVLNNYFNANNNSYQAGRVSYKMSEQTEGAHTLTFRAWDLYNNSTTATLNFHVVKGLDPNIYSVTTYPNPVASTGVMNVEIMYDRPDDINETMVHLFDISGKLVYTHQQTRADRVLLNMNQIAINPGIYLYQVKIKTATSDFVSKAGKIIVTK